MIRLRRSSERHTAYRAAGPSDRRWPLLLGRSLLVALGLCAIVMAINGAAEPLRRVQEFHEALACEPGARECVADETGTITGRNTWSTTTTGTDANGHTYTTSKTRYGVFWRWADGSRDGREVSREVYNAAREGQPITLRVWHGELVGIAVEDKEEWFLPEPGRQLQLWLSLAFLGIGILLWAILFEWVDDFGTAVLACLAFSLVLGNIAAEFLTFGLVSLKPLFHSLAALVITVACGVILFRLIGFLVDMRSRSRR